MVGWYGLLLLLAYRLKFSRRWTAIGVITGLALLATEFLPVARPDHETTLTLLDVGQGSAMVIEMPDHQVILVDGGRKQSPGRTGFDVGKELIAPYLWQQKIRHLEAVVCSHPDADHYNGIPFMLRQFRPHVLWINGFEGAEKEYSAMLRLASELKIAVRVPTPGTNLSLTEEAALTVIAGGQQPEPGADHARSKTRASSNNQSLVLRLSHGETSFLLPSDIGFETEEALLGQADSKARLKADLLVAPHHGSATSSSQEFLQAVGPRLIAISAGQNQAGYFPAPETLARYRRQGCTIFNTAAQGSLFFHSNGQEILVGKNMIYQ
jgi:competence protein ComEC